MGRMLTWLLVAVTVGGAATVAATMGGVPPRIATHFGAGGAADSWMTRDGYLAFMLVFVLGLPWFVYVMAAVLPGRFPRFTNLPNRDHWLAPAQQGGTLAALRAFGAGIAILMALMVTSVHFAILHANTVQPARLAEGPFVAGLLLFVAAVAALVVGIYRRFRSAPANPGRR